MPRRNTTPRPGDPRAPHLPAQVAEADVQLVLLAGLPLVSAAVLCGGTGGAETRISPSAHAAVSAGAWPLRHKRCSGPAAPGLVSTHHGRSRPACPPPAPSPRSWHSGSSVGAVFLRTHARFRADIRRIPWGNQSPSTPHAATEGCPEGSASDQPRCGRPARPTMPSPLEGAGEGTDRAWDKAPSPTTTKKK